MAGRSNSTRNDPQKTISQQISEVIPIVLDAILLLLKIIYWCLVSLFRLFKPVPLVSVKEEIVLVTGAGHGIGRELALKYAAQGSKLVLWDINKAGNEETAKLILKAKGQKPFTYICDVSDRKSVLATAKKVQDEAGDVTILINNAGIMPAHTLENHTEDDIKRIMNINVMAHFWTIEAFLPSMKANNYGHIVALSSIAGIVGLPNLVPYCASKFAVRGLMESLKEELYENCYNNIGITIIYPYMTNTGLCKKPYVRFEKMLALLNPTHVAEEIMRAQRSGVYETTIPGYLLKTNNLARLFPIEAALAVKKFFNSGVYPD